MTETGASAGARSIVRACTQRVRAAVQAIASRLPFTLYLHERHIWFVVDVTADRALRPLPEGFALSRVGPDQLGVLKATGASFDSAATFAAAGNQPWVVRENGNPVFTFWIFSNTMPTYAAPHGWLALPPGTVNLEDSMVSPSFRGRGIAPSTFDELFTGFTAAGDPRYVITIVHETNEPSRRAAAKVGWHEFALVDIKKFGLVRRTSHWRERADDHSPLMRTKLAIEARPGVAGVGMVERHFTWLVSALKSDTRGPGRG